MWAGPGMHELGLGVGGIAEGQETAELVAGMWVGAVWHVQVCIVATAAAPSAVGGHHARCDPKELLLHREMVLPEHTLHCSVDLVCWMQCGGGERVCS